MSNIEEMHSFFNKRVKSYDEHMKETNETFEEYYLRLSEEIEVTLSPVKILDLGCGTGAELEGIFKRVPDAQITCVDLAEDMLEKMKQKYCDKINQIEIIEKSYFNYDFLKYDYVVSVMTMHHWLPDDKIELYKKIRASLKTNGKYIEGDYYVDKEKEKNLMEKRKKLLVGKPKDLFYHIDIPFARKTQQKLYFEAGFKSFRIAFAFNEKEIHVVTV